MAIEKVGNQTIVVFGNGDIVVSTASPVIGGLNTELVFSESDGPHEIGSVREEAIGVRTDELRGTVIRLQFNKLESLKVVEYMLMAIKADMMMSSNECHKE